MIQPHTDHDGTTGVRAHLGLSVPAGAALRVGPHARAWREGRWLVFNGDRNHEALHTGTAPRIVLLLDFAGGGHVAPEQWPGWIQEMHGAHQLAVRAEVADDGPGSASSALW